MAKTKLIILSLFIALFSINTFSQSFSGGTSGERLPLNQKGDTPRPRTPVQETIYCYVSQNAIEFELPADVEFAYLTIGDATCPILTDIVYQDDNVVVIPTLVSDCAITLTTDAGTEYYGFIQVD